jgi:hypothetical protein
MIYFYNLEYIFIYSHHVKTGQSGIQMVIFWTQFVSGFQMV